MWNDRSDAGPGRTGAGRNGTRALGLALAVALALPAGAFGLAEPPEVPDDPIGAALALAAQARGVPGAQLADPASELGLAQRDLRSTLAEYYVVVIGHPLDDAQLARALAQLAPLSPAWRAGVTEVLAAMSAAQRLRNEAFAGLSWAELGLAHQVALRAQSAPGTVAPSDALRAVGILERIDAAKVLHAAGLLQAAAAEAMVLFEQEGAPDEPIHLAFDALTIGSPGPDTYTVDKQLLIEPGGDDLYLNNEGGALTQAMFDATGGCVFGGGTTGRASPNLACTPLPSQVCTYDVLNNAAGTGMLPEVGVPNHEAPGSSNGHDGSCGSDARREALAAHAAGINHDGDARLVAALLDLRGSDRYEVPWTHEDKLFGLVDFCYPGDEEKVNTNRDLFQGGSLAGISLLWDAGTGTNSFRGRLNAQGSGHVGGAAMLLRTGDGDDFYWADRLSQGNGIAAGVGVLVDTGGTNTYLLDPPIVYRNEFRPNGRDCAQEGRAGQGQGGFLGVGVLWNQGPRSAYRAVVHRTDPAYPFDAVRDGAGAPVLDPGNDAQGSGESFPIVDTPGGVVAGIGLLVDRTDGADTLCEDAGMASGADYRARAPGEVLIGCGKFNVPRELDLEGDAEGFFQHLVSGAVGLRVVV